MDEDSILNLVKAVLGYRSTVRDELLKVIIKSVITELKDNKGIVLEPKSDEQVMFIVDLAALDINTKAVKQCLVILNIVYGI